MNLLRNLLNDELGILIKFGLNDDKLKGIGINLVGHRDKILESLKELRK
jgi:hypothetical protein